MFVKVCLTFGEVFFVNLDDAFQAFQCLFTLNLA